MTAPAWRTAARLRPRDFADGALAIVLGVVVLAGFLWIAGLAVVPGISALWRGAFGSWYGFTSATLVRATPLIILGLAFALGARGGALNIGMEGQFAAGAIAATAIALQVPELPRAVALAVLLGAGLVAGAAWVVVPVMLRTRLSVSEVITTLLLNFVAVAAVSLMVTGPLQEPSRQYPQSATIGTAWRLPHLGAITRLHLGFIVALAVAGALSLTLSRTKWGFSLSAAGTGPRAAAISGGINVPRVAAFSLLASGALAGLGGAIEVSGVSYALYQNLSPGYGFTAIAVALLGRMQPWLIVLAGVMFGALEAGAGAMQRDAGVPAVAVQVVEAVVIIMMLLSSRKRA